MRAVTAGEAPAGEDGNDPTPEVQVSAGSRWLWCVSTPVLAAGMLLASGCAESAAPPEPEPSAA